jgi:hypothetical protein
VSAGQSFTPTAGLPVKARIGGKVCGQARTSVYEGQVVYAINVSADGPGSMAGCGSFGKPVSFTVGSRAMAATATWDNSAVAELPLHPAAANSIFLPIILKAR